MTTSLSPLGVIPTIVAQATPPGISALAIIRLTGPKTLPILSSITHKPSSFFHHGKAALTSIYNSSGNLLDETVITFYKSPLSYTGEDVADISCHGGLSTPKSILSSCLHQGAVPAPPGEFTKRAFLNGKIDLTQAEAIADLIRAKTEKSQRFSAAALKGILSNEITDIRENLILTISHMEAELDFLEDEINFTTHEVWTTKISTLKNRLSSLLSTFDSGHIYQLGATVVISGNPNVGKSSLLNALLQKNRVIVSHEAGTTRDAIDAFYETDGVPIKFVDTAGIRFSGSPVEARGVEIAQDYINTADLVLWVWEALTPTDILTKCIHNPPFKSPFILVLNKIDLVDSSHRPLIPNNVDHVFVSAKTGFNLSILLSAIKNLLVSDISTDQPLLTNKRHETEIKNTIVSLNNALTSLSTGTTIDTILTDLRISLSHLDTILGKTTTDEILDKIFGEFCIGK
ncbi:MAG: tRNA uridine-5-carboxymethylaminomethyl(34) synthesis GTPase MnmE [Fidelibacterota bacterium]